MTFLSVVVKDGSQVWDELQSPTPSPTYSINRSNRTCIRNFRVDADSVLGFIDECFPAEEFPGKHPTWPFLYVDSIDLSPFQNDGTTFSEVSAGVQEPDYWLAVVRYAPIETTIRGVNIDPIDPVDPIDFLVGNISYTTETMTLPGFSMEWEKRRGEKIKAPDFNMPLVIPIMQFDLTMPRVRVIPWSAIRENMGHVNEARWFGGDIETVLYLGANISYRFSTDGDRQFDVAHSFMEKRIKWSDEDGDHIYGWNHLFDETTAQFDRPVVTHSSEDQFLYPLSDTFSDLLVR